MTSTTEKGFFDLHITGLGYLNRIREVNPKRGTSFWACDIAALNGPSDDVSYTRFDCRVSGQMAEKLVKRCEQAVNRDKKVLIGFKLGDLWTDTFTYSKGDRAGQTGVSLKARLLFISWIKINGEEVYRAEPREEAMGQEAQPSPEAQPSSNAGASNQPAAAPAAAGEAAGSFESPVMA